MEAKHHDESTHQKPNGSCIPGAQQLHHPLVRVSRSRDVEDGVGLELHAILGYVDQPKRDTRQSQPQETDISTVWVAHIILCSNVETGIGCFASSIPSLRRYFHAGGEGSSDPNSKRTTATKLVTVGGSRRPRVRESFRNPTDIGFSLSTVHHGRTEDSWERLQDGSSDKSVTPIDPKGIYAERSYAVDIESDPDYNDKERRSYGGNAY
jgi:hypothetical protein